MPHQPQISANFDYYLHSGTKLLEKIICVFDDLPFLFMSKSAESLGTLLLAAAGFVVFPLELAEGVSGFKKARKRHVSSPERKVLITNHLLKITFASSGIVISGGLLAFILASKTLAATVTSPFIPIVIAMIVGVELKQKKYKLQLAKERQNVNEIIAGKRQVAFAGTYFGCSLAVAGLASIITLNSLGVLSLGIVPSIVLVSVVVVAVAIKIFELIDKGKDFRFTDAIRKFFNGKEDAIAQRDPRGKRDEGNPREKHLATCHEICMEHRGCVSTGWLSFFNSKEERPAEVTEIKGLELRALRMQPA